MKKIWLLTFMMLLSIIPVLYSSGPFEDNFNGTIGDKGTSLEWLKCSAPQTYSGGNCTGTVQAYTWESALAYCENLTLGGGGWRLPSINELVSIMDNSRNPAIHSFFSTPITNDSEYWSSTTYVKGISESWSVSFYNAGFTTTRIKNEAYPYVRCVRGP